VALLPASKAVAIPGLVHGESTLADFNILESNFQSLNRREPVRMSARPMPSSFLKLQQGPRRGMVLEVLALGSLPVATLVGTQAKLTSRARPAIVGSVRIVCKSCSEFGVHPRERLVANAQGRNTHMTAQH
jgi:hypothetical protein